VLCQQRLHRCGTRFEGGLRGCDVCPSDRPYIVLLTFYGDHQQHALELRQQRLRRLRQQGLGFAAGVDLIILIFPSQISSRAARPCSPPALPAAGDLRLISGVCRLTRIRVVDGTRLLSASSPSPPAEGAAYILGSSEAISVREEGGRASMVLMSRSFVASSRSSRLGRRRSTPASCSRRRWPPDSRPTWTKV